MFESACASCASLIVLGLSAEWENADVDAQKGRQIGALDLIWSLHQSAGLGVV